MDYVREHIKQYWGMAYRRTLGIAIITLAVIFAMGITITTLGSNLHIGNYFDYILIWLVLSLMGIAIFLYSLYRSHITSIKYMTPEEHRSHSKYMSVWILSIVLGGLAFILPLFFANSDIEPLILLFGLGGIFWILYGTVAVIFKHRYGELAIGGTAFWIMFFVGLSELNSTYLSYLNRVYFTTYFTVISITVISGFIGLALIVNSSRESLEDFAASVEKIERNTRKSIRKSKK